MNERKSVLAKLNNQETLITINDNIVDISNEETSTRSKIAKIASKTHKN